MPKTAKKKTKTPLYVTTSTVDEANTLYTRGVVVKGTWYLYKPFTDSAALQQYYRYYNFGYVVKIYAIKTVRYRYYNLTYKKTKYQAKKNDLKEVIFRGLYMARTRYVNCAKKHLVQSKQYLVRVKWIVQVKE